MDGRKPPEIQIRLPQHTGNNLGGVFPPSKSLGFEASLSDLDSLVQLLSSVQFSCSVMSDSLRPHESQHARPPSPSPTPGVHPDSRPSSQ